MKHTCAFCKTEYNLGPNQFGPVECVVCGHISVAVKKKNKISFLTFIAAASALLAAIIFTTVIIINHKISNIRKNPLVAEISDITKTTDELGNQKFVVSGQVLNRSEKIYGIPDLIITCLDSDENVISTEKFMPTATLLDSGGKTEFKHVLSGTTENVKKITAKLKNNGE
jgi:hypothetical protein